MAKKRKASRSKDTGPTGPKGYDPKDARLGPITTFADIADEKEQYFLDQDKIMLEDEPGTKRQKRRQEEEEFLELSDEEILPENADSSDSEDEAELRRKARAVLKKKNKKQPAFADGDDDGDVNNGDDIDEDDLIHGRIGRSAAKGAAAAAGTTQDDGWWGSSRKEYYDNDEIENEDNALEEEATARELQKKQLSRMKSADFFDAYDWLEEDESAGAAEGKTDKKKQDGGVVTLTVKTAEEINAMTPDEQQKHYMTLYPEYDYLCDEVEALVPLYCEYKGTAEGKPLKSLEGVQYLVLGLYLSAIALYFSLLMSPLRDNPGGGKHLMDPQELHDHEIMNKLVACRDAWERVKCLQEARKSEEASGTKTVETAKKVSPKDTSAVRPHKSTTKSTADKDGDDEEEEVPVKKTKKSEKTKKDKRPGATVSKGVEVPVEKTKKSEKTKKDKRPGATVSKEVEESLAELSQLLVKAKKNPRKTVATAAKADEDNNDDGHSDFGEEEILDARTAEEKQKRKKTLGFYTSQIMQKSNLRTGGGGAQASGGDMDIPYRERLKDRQARLMAAAKRRGQSDALPGEELGGDDDDDDVKDDASNKDEVDEARKYYNDVVERHKIKMAAKAARKAEAQAGKLVRVVPDNGMDEAGRRQLTYEIEKNKGLNHRTIKEKKNNPRVKKRIKFEKKKKQIASMRPQYKGTNRDHYQGETTGIKTGLVRSIKLD